MTQHIENVGYVPPEHHVYWVIAPVSGHLKVGASVNPVRRLQELSSLFRRAGLGEVALVRTEACKRIDCQYRHTDDRRRKCLTEGLLQDRLADEYPRTTESDEVFRVGRLECIRLVSEVHGHITLPSVRADIRKIEQMAMVGLLMPSAEELIDLLDEENLINVADEEDLAHDGPYWTSAEE